MSYHLVYWEWHHGGRPAPTLVRAPNAEKAAAKVIAKKSGSHQEITIRHVERTDPSRWPVCSCGSWFVSDRHARDCPAFGNFDGTWLTREWDDRMARTLVEVAGK